MIPNDPRKRGAAAATAAATASSILLGGQDAMEVDEVMPAAPLQPVKESTELISRIITPPPVPTSSRFRNALNRITTNPQSDVEAWQALITEVNAIYRSIPNIHSVDAETQAKLDWVESCYGALLHNFSYAVNYYHAIAEMLLAQSARVGEDGGPLLDYGMETTRRAMRCEAKVEAVFVKMLGVDKEGNRVEGINPVKSGICSWSVDLWLLYIRKATRDAIRASTSLPLDERPKSVRDATKKAYDTALSYAASAHKNHELWKAYVQYIRSWVPDPTTNTDHALAQQQMLDLRSVYKRLVVHPMTGLDQLWQEYEAFERAQNETLAQALVAELAPKYQHARSVYLERQRVFDVEDLQLDRLATPPVEKDDEDYSSKMEEEHTLLNLWTTRCSYERTNPERLTPAELSQRVRQIFQEMACVLTRHPESWHMWSTWELLVSVERTKAEKAVAVLQLGQEHIPDCTLLAYAEAQIVEHHNTDNPTRCMQVLERFLERSPNTLGFVLYQKMVRRYKGMDDARAVFAKARRTLADSIGTKSDNEASKTIETAEGEVEADVAEQLASKEKDNDLSKQRWVVTNRLDTSISGQSAGDPYIKEGNPAKNQESIDETTNGHSAPQIPPGPITWHLYASHAMMEHRLNRSPEVAARVYELGLRKHASFLTKPPYVMRYAQLLLELGDTVNLRALLTNSVSACQAKELGSALAAIWDMTLYFESLLSGSDVASASTLRSIEAKRHEALMGPDVEDVATGGLIGGTETALIGAQKSSISEQLVRTEGYEVSSSIVNGMSRTVDMFGVMGLWGSDDVNVSTRAKKRKGGSDADKNEDISGGKSDASYQDRLAFRERLSSGMAGEAAADSALGSKILSARERLQQGSTAAMAGGGQSAMMLAIQQSPEWLRGLLLLLPASRLRLPIVAKPPPHLTEMALTAITQNPLPAERPADTESASGKQALANGDDSDDENGGKAGGYGQQFRSRQRTRQQSGL